MARPLRIEFAGALYHVTARGNEKREIYFSDADRERFLEILAQVIERYRWHCHGYCLMSNHYHLLIEIGGDNLSKGMRQLNGVYTQYVNREHGRAGHLLQGRYKAILVEKDSHLLELARYVVLNPVRAEMVRAAKDWPWSSYRATAGMVAKPAWLTTDWLLQGFGTDREQAAAAYRRFVAEGRGQPSPWAALRNQIYLGSEAFVERMQGRIAPNQSLEGVPRAQKLPAKLPLETFAKQTASRDECMARAYHSGHYSLAEIGGFFGVSHTTVARAAKKYKLER